MSRAYVADGAGEPPVLLQDGTFLMETMDGTKALAGTKQVWSHELGARSSIAFGRDALVVGDDAAAEGRLVLWRVGADGTVRWQAQLPGVHPDLYWPSDGRVAASGSTLAISVHQQLVVYALSPG
ncbi:MAG: hypothetical protein AAF721_37910 [Myxococcota bacterium]